MCFCAKYQKIEKEGKIRNYERPLEQSVEVTLGYLFERSEKAFEDVLYV